jgi:hypothetical protein
VKYWEIIADKVSKAGWSLGWVSAIDSEGRTTWIVDAHRDNGKRFVVRSDEMLSAFLELERIMHELALSALLGDDSNWDRSDVSSLTIFTESGEDAESGETAVSLWA